MTTDNNLPGPYTRTLFGLVRGRSGAPGLSLALGNWER